MRTNKTRAVTFAFYLTALLTFASEHAWANRYYAPGLGRYISRDPISHEDSENLYEYVNARVTGYIDTDGLKKKVGEWVNVSCDKEQECRRVAKFSVLEMQSTWYTRDEQGRICIGQFYRKTCMCQVVGRKVWLGIVSPTMGYWRNEERKYWLGRGYTTRLWETPGEHEWGPGGRPTGNANTWDNPCPQCTCVQILFIAGHYGMVHQAALGLLPQTEFCDPCAIYLKGCFTADAVEARQIQNDSGCRVRGTNASTLTGDPLPPAWFDPPLPGAGNRPQPGQKPPVKK